MGSILQAKCPCGFESKEVYAGGGMMDFMTVCNAPAVCRKCPLFLVRNWLKRPATCPQCGGRATFYDDPAVQEARPSADGDAECVCSWGTEEKGKFVLPATRYLCPTCGKLTMQFEDVGCWD